MTLAEFEQIVYEVAMSSAICGVPSLRRLTTTLISLRIGITAGGFVDVFYNEQTGTTAYAWIRADLRVFGADNTGEWHIHPLEDPSQHELLSGPLSLSDFIRQIGEWTG